MKVVIATPILYDETSPFNHLMKDILQGFLDAGYEVTRIIATESLEDTPYKMGLDDITYIPVIRKKMERANIIKRYITDSLTNIKMARLIKKIQADVLFEDVSYSSYWSIRAAKRMKIKVISMLQDVWPDNAVQSHLIDNGSLVYKFFEFWQRKVYKNSDRIICISDDMKAFIESKGVPSEKLEVIYNWGYNDEPVNISWEDNEFVKKYNLKQDKFYAVYAGNIGRMQNVELIVKAAKLLETRNDIHFLIVGDGVMQDEIKTLSANMKNVTMLPLQPSNLATSIYSMANVNIIPLVPGGLKVALPSKIGVCLSCGNPIIACVDEGSKLGEKLKEYKAGIVVSPLDESALRDAIIYYHKIGQIPKKYDLYVEFFERSNNEQKYSRMLEI